MRLPRGLATAAVFDIYIGAFLGETFAIPYFLFSRF